jgi:hypothetical protein
MNPFACFALATLLLAPLITMQAADDPLNASSAAGAERVAVTFAADDSVFPNPERGFYFSYMPPGGGRVGQQETMHAPLVTEDLKALRARPEAITLIRDCILIPRRFWNAPISRDYLDRLQRDFDTVRAAGIKSALFHIQDSSAGFASVREITFTGDGFVNEVMETRGAETRSLPRGKGWFSWTLFSARNESGSGEK